MLDIKQIGNRIRELRRERGITQAQFARELHVSFQAVSNWERGIAPPELENLVNIASYFGILLDSLIRERDESFFLGIDGGGTKTEFTVTDSNGRVMLDLIKQGSNPTSVGFEASFNIISSGINDALVRFPNISCVFCGAAGMGVADNRDRMAARIKEKYPSLKLVVKTDSANLFGMEDDSDMVVIAGTGSVVFVKKRGECTRLGGWGYLLDSAGSAYDIGRDALTHALSQEDGCEIPTRLTLKIRKKLGSECVFDTIRKLYSDGPHCIAALAPTVFEAYIEGDSASQGIIEKSAVRLAQLLNYGVQAHGARKKAIAGGGLFENYSDLLVPIISKYSDVEIYIPGYPQVYGACREAVKLSGNAVCESFGENFKKSYVGVKNE